MIVEGDVELSTPTRLKSLSAHKARVPLIHAIPSTFSSELSKAIKDDSTSVFDTETTPMLAKSAGLNCSNLVNVPTGVSNFPSASSKPVISVAPEISIRKSLSVRLSGTKTVRSRERIDQTTEHSAGSNWIRSHK